MTRHAKFESSSDNLVPVAEPLEAICCEFGSGNTPPGAGTPSEAIGGDVSVFLAAGGDGRVGGASIPLTEPVGGAIDEVSLGGKTGTVICTSPEPEMIFCYRLFQFSDFNCGFTFVRVIGG